MQNKMKQERAIMYSQRKKGRFFFSGILHERDSTMKMGVQTVGWLFKSAKLIVSLCRNPCPQDASVDLKKTITSEKGLLGNQL